MISGFGSGGRLGALFALALTLAATPATPARVVLPQPLKLTAVRVFSDTGPTIDRGVYIETSPMARAVYETDATLLRVQSWSSLHARYPQYASLGVWVNGRFYGALVPDRTGLSEHLVPLPAGHKRVEIVNGLTSKPSSTLLGTWLVAAGANAPLIATRPDDSGGLLLEGDSITVGADADPEQQRSIVPLLRVMTGKPVTLEGWGWRSLHDVAATPQARATFVERVRAIRPAAIYIALGTNDYGLARWGAADYGRGYGLLLDELHAALPSLTIYVQSPLRRAKEHPNRFGDSLDAYRFALAETASTRPWAAFVDGRPFVGIDDLSDGLHPGNEGHQKWAAAVRLVVGL